VALLCSVIGGCDFGPFFLFLTRNSTKAASRMEVTERAATIAIIMISCCPNFVESFGVEAGPLLSLVDLVPAGVIRGSFVSFIFAFTTAVGTNLAVFASEVVVVVVVSSKVVVVGGKVVVVGSTVVVVVVVVNLVVVAIVVVVGGGGVGKSAFTSPPFR